MFDFLDSFPVRLAKRRICRHNSYVGYYGVSYATFFAQALWQLFWTNPASLPLPQRSNFNLSGRKRLTLEAIKDRAKIGISELLSQVILVT